jgi:translation initiation factor IF-2
MAEDITPQKKKTVEIPAELSVRELADLIKTTPVEVIKQLMRKGVMANINQIIGYDTAAAVATALGYEPRPKTIKPGASTIAIGEIKKKTPVSKAGLKTRPPVVTIMGHVDHGKTTLLDAIRHSNVAAGEVGSITQHIGAYQVEFKGQKITFLDTPGHEAFTAMRARGAQVTDITVLVVAADDGVMPQTIEAISHAKAAGVPIIVAINKIDKPGANPENVKRQLAEAGLLIEEWGGESLSVPVSAKTGAGIVDLLESILLVAEMEEITADPSKPASGVIIESRLDRSRGPLATALILNGTLREGNIVVADTTWGKVKAMFNDTGKQIRRAPPATPVVILGLHEVPPAGAILRSVSDERQVKALIQKQEEGKRASRPLTLTTISSQIASGEIKELNLIIKADVQGSLEAIRNSLEKLSTERTRTRILHSASGSVTENDVMLAMASKALILAFNTSVDPAARHLADSEGVDIRQYDIIYQLIDDVTKALQGMLEPKETEVILGRATVRAAFPGTKRTTVAGVYVNEGKIERGARARVIRKGQTVVDSVITSLRRFKEDVREASAGYECGVVIQNFNNVQVGDLLESYKKVKT